MHAYLDDVRVDATSLAAVVQATNFLASHLPTVGIQLNKLKSVVATDDMEAARTYLPDCTIVPLAEDSWLGIPIAADVAAERAAVSSAVLPKMTAAVEAISNIADLQTRLLLLRYCVNSKTAHYARSLAPAAAGRMLSAVQALVDGCVMAIADAPGHSTLGPARTLFLEAARRPVRLGGLGLGCLARHAPLAYLASVWQATATWSRFTERQHLVVTLMQTAPVSLTNAIADARLVSTAIKTIKSTTTNTTPVTLPATCMPPPITPDLDALTLSPLPEHLEKWSAAPRKLQGTLITNAAYLDMYNARARRLAVADKTKPQEAELALELARLNPATMLPLTTTGSHPRFHLRNDEFRLTLRRAYFLPCIPLLGLSYQDVCTCGRPGQQPPLVTEVHLHNCRRKGYFGIRHDAVRDHLMDIVTLGGYTPEAEAAVAPGSASARSDLLVRHFYSAAGQGHTAALVDINIPSALSTELLPAAAITPGLQLSKAVTRKINKYNHLPVPADQRVVPLCWLSSGEADVGVKAFLWDAGRRVGQQAPEDASWMQPTWTAYHMQALAFTIARETARCWLRMTNVA